jgi:tripartite-type tricarboxylate transporter receptor subunit TctC
MRLITRSLIRLCALACLASAAVAQTFPNKPVTLMVPYPAGGLSDVIARTVNTTLAKHLGQPVLVENLGGASGGIAAQKVLNSPADGHIIFQGSPNELILAPLANAAIKYKPEDFRLVQMIAVNPMAMFARKDLPASNGEELLAYARKAAAANKPLTYASVGPGSMYHMLGEHMSKITGIPMTHVPYKGAAPAFQDMMAGLVDVFMTPYGKGQVALVDEGRLKTVAVLSTDRQGLLKNAPPLQDAPALKGFVFDIWTGYFVHKDTPEPVVQALHKAISEVLGDAAIRSALEAHAMQVPRPAPLAAMTKVYADNTSRFRGIARSINMQPQ